MLNLVSLSRLLQFKLKKTEKQASKAQPYWFQMKRFYSVGKTNIDQWWMYVDLFSAQKSLSKESFDEIKDLKRRSVFNYLYYCSYYIWPLEGSRRIPNIDSRQEKQSRNRKIIANLTFHFWTVFNILHCLIAHIIQMAYNAKKILIIFWFFFCPFQKIRRHEENVSILFIINYLLKKGTNTWWL